MYDFNINNFNNNENVIDIFLIKEVTQDKARNDSRFLNIVLSNKLGDINCKLWDSSENDMLFFKNNNMVKVMATVNEYKGTKQLIIKKYKGPDENEPFDASKLLEVSNININEAFDELVNTAEQFENTTLKTLTLELLKDNEQLIKKAGAAKVHHHNIVGGWLEHTLTMLRDGKHLSKAYSNNLNIDLFYSGIILHDIGKLKEFNFNPYGIVEDYTMEGELLGHITLGIQIITEYQTKLSQLNSEWDYKIVSLLNHLILSHHGQPEYGSPKYPMIKEAELLSSLDMLDTKMYMFDKVSNGLNYNEFSQRQWALDNRKIYKY